MSHLNYLLEYQDTIRAYIDKSLDAERLKNFEAALQNDENLRQELKRHQDLEMLRRSYTFIKAQPEISQILKEPIEPDFKQYDAMKSGETPARGIPGRIMRVGALVIILLMVGGIFWRTSARQHLIQLKEIAAPYIKPIKILFIFNHPQPADVFPKAMEEYEKGHYEQTLKYLNGFTGSPDDADPAFYSGISLMMLKRYGEAYGPLKSAAKSNTVISSPARWYLGACLSRNGENERGGQFIEMLKNDEDYKVSAEVLFESNIGPLTARKTIICLLKP